VRRWPALGGPYSAPGQRIATGRSVRRRSARTAAPRLASSGTSTGAGGWARARRARRPAREAVDEPRQALGVQPAGVGQQAVAELADIAGAPWNRARRARAPTSTSWAARSRGCTGVRELARQRASRREVQAAVREWRLDQAAHARMRPNTGGTRTARARRRPLLVRLAQQREQRLGEDRVAHPGGRDDQDALGCHGGARRCGTAAVRPVVVQWWPARARPSTRYSVPQ